MNQKTCRFMNLLEQFQESGKQVGLTTYCGTRLGVIVEINQDYLKFKVLDPDSMLFYNIYLTLQSVIGIEESEPNE